MFLSVVPSVWHILVRVCCDAQFLPCFFRLTSSVSCRLQWPPCRTEDIFILCQLFYRMTSIVFDVHTVGVGCKDQVCKCLFVVMSAVAGRTRVNWRYRTLRLGVIRQG